MVKRYINKRFGEQCDSFEPGCPLCFAWLCYYYLFEDDKIIWEDEQWKLKELVE